MLTLGPIGFAAPWLLLALHLHRGAVGENNLLRKDFNDKDSLYAEALLKAVSSNKIKSKVVSTSIYTAVYPYVNAILQTLIFFVYEGSSHSTI
jgi:hypothetical protein